MPLSSIFQRKSRPAAGGAPADDTLSVQQARQRARQRLIGAALLLAAGVVVFPMLFETQPRPLPAAVPIETPRTAAVSPTATNEPLAPAQAPAAAPMSAPSEAAAGEPAPPAASGAPARAPATASAPQPATARVASAPAARTASAPTARLPPAASQVAAAVALPRAAPAAAAAAANPASSRAGGGASAPRDVRFVVQVGAYTDPATLRDVRAKVEKLGLTTYTQAIDTEAGKRTRVRVGPFVSRQEAEAASARLKAAGLPGNVLTL